MSISLDRRDLRKVPDLAGHQDIDHVGCDYSSLTNRALFLDEAE